jgi:uncharacterized protein (TIGR01777 family)
MRVVLVGGSGFIGRRLRDALVARGDDVIVTSLRDPVRAAADAAGSDVIVNLAGAPVSTRWTAAHKAAIEASRVAAPRAFLQALSDAGARPAAYISASATGYYGMSRTATFTENSPPGDDFLARVCVAWEAQAETARAAGTRVACIRTGLVLGTGGGALGALVPIFRLGLGGVVGSGEQWYSWIHLDDLIGIYLRAIDGLDGAFNATAPHPVRNRDFTHALGKALRRPTFLPTPAFALRLMLGEGAVIVTEGQRVLPEATLAHGYVFRHPELGGALLHLLSS